MTPKGKAWTILSKFPIYLSASRRRKGNTSKTLNIPHPFLRQQGLSISSGSEPEIKNVSGTPPSKGSESSMLDKMLRFANMKPSIPGDMKPINNVTRSLDLQPRSRKETEQDAFDDLIDERMFLKLLTHPTVCEILQDRLFQSSGSASVDNTEESFENSGHHVVGGYGVATQLWRKKMQQLLDATRELVKVKLIGRNIGKKDARGGSSFGRDDSLQVVTNLERKVAKLILKIADNVSDENNVQIMFACGALANPKSLEFWSKMDVNLQRIMKLKTCFLRTIILGAYTISIAANEHSSMQRVKFSCFDELMKPIAQSLSSMMNKSTRPHANDIECKDLDYISMCLSVLASSSLNNPSLFTKATMSNISQVLQTALQNVPPHINSPTQRAANVSTLNSLRSLWESIPLIPFLKDDYSINSELYRLSFEILMGNNDMSSGNRGNDMVYSKEEIFTSLLESLNKSKIRDPRVMSKVNDYFFENPDFDVTVTGIRLFNVLLELGLHSLGMRVLHEMLEKSQSFDDPDRVFRGQTAKWRRLSVRNPSSDAKLNIANALSNTRGRLYNKMDLMLALFCFSRDAMSLLSSSPLSSSSSSSSPSSSSSTTPYGVLTIIEGELLPKIKQELSLKDAISVLQFYAIGGRFHTDMLRELDKVIVKNAESLNVSELRQILWASARLNYRLSSFLPSIVDKLILLEAGTEGNNEGEMRIEREELRIHHSHVILDAWAAAVLGLLTVSHWRYLEPYVMRFSHRTDGKQMHPFAAHQLRQIMAELRLVCVKDDADRQWLSTLRPWEKNDPSVQGHGEAFIIHDNNRVSNSKSAWKQRERSSESYYRTDIKFKDTQSSLTHQSISLLLTELGYAHSNEHCLEYGYMVDIFIREQDLPQQYKDNNADMLAKYPQGIVIEYDGPSHFDSYLWRPLGPTAMKHRHLGALGYRVISIPYWSYRLAQSKEKQLQCIKEALQGY